MATEELEQLAPYLRLLGPLQGCHFAGAVPVGGWKELARTLRECSHDEAHAERIVSAFVRTPRYDKDGQLLTAVPAAIELRLFARRIPEIAVPAGSIPAPCAACAELPGWKLVDINGNGTRAICDCARGIWQAAANRANASIERRPRATNEMADWGKRAAGDLD